MQHYQTFPTHPKSRAHPLHTTSCCLPIFRGYEDLNFVSNTLRCGERIHSISYRRGYELGMCYFLAVTNKNLSVRLRSTTQGPDVTRRFDTSPCHSEGNCETVGQFCTHEERDTHVNLNINYVQMDCETGTSYRVPGGVPPLTGPGVLTLGSDFLSIGSGHSVSFKVL